MSPNYKKDRLSIVGDFRESIEKLSEFFSLHDGHIEPYRASGINFFEMLSFASQVEALASVNFYLETLNATENSGLGVWDNYQFLWNSLRVLGLSGSKEIFSNSLSGKTIEIYDLNGKQIWRNLQFMNSCSYTWDELFSIRESSLFDFGFESSLFFVEVAGKFSLMVDLEYSRDCLPRFTRKENLSLSRLEVAVRHELYCRLKNSLNNTAAWLIVSEVEIITEKITIIESFESFQNISI